MAEQLVMNANGHDTHAFDKADKVSMQEAEARFNELKQRGIWIEPGKDGEPGRILKVFDPSVDTMRFQPQLKAG